MLVLYLILNSLFNWTRLICLEGHAELLESLGGDETYSPGNYGTFYILPILVFQFKNSINIKIINIKQFIILKMSCLNIFINITLSCFKLCLLTAVFFSNRGAGIKLGKIVFPVVFFFFFNLINFFFLVVFVIHWHDSAMDIHVFLIPIPPPTSLSTRSLWVFLVHQVRALVSCIRPGLVICFTLDNIHVSMLFSWNIPPLPSPTESKSLFYTSVSLFLFCI